MLGGPRVVIQILADASKAQRELKGASTTFGKVEQGLGSMVGPSVAALGAIALLGGGAAKMASDVEQSFGALDSVFGDFSDDAKALAKTASTDVGLASSEYAQLAAVLGAQLKNAGTAMDDLAPSTDRLIDLGADLSATFGGTTADAVAAVSSLLRGERDPIEKYGVAIKQADVNARLAAKGLDKLEGEAKRTAEAQATLEILTEQTADAQGAFARESDTAAHATQVSEAAMKDAGAAIGTALLPLVVALSGAMATVATWMGENADLVRTVAVVVGILATAILAVNVALSAYKAVTTAVTAAQWLLNAAMTANPIGLVVLAIVALIAAIVLLWHNSETFRAVVTAAFEAVSKVVRTVVDAIIAVFRTAFAIITAIVGPLAGVLSGPVNAFLGVVRSVLGLVGALFRVAAGVVTGIMSALAGILRGPIDAFLTVVRTVLATVGGLFRAGIDGVRSIFATLTAVLTKPFREFQNVVKTVMGAVKRAVKGVADFITGIFRGISNTIDSISGALDAIPFALPPTSAPPAPAGVAGPSTFAARGGAPQQTRGQKVVMVLDGHVFGQATLGAVRRYDRRNGPAQVIPRWS